MPKNTAATSKTNQKLAKAQAAAPVGKAKAKAHKQDVIKRENEAHAPVKEVRPVLYPIIELIPCWNGQACIPGLGPNGTDLIINGVGEITRQQAEEMMGWETESSYKRRMMAENPARVARGEREVTEEECTYSIMSEPDSDGKRKVIGTNHFTTVPVVYLGDDGKLKTFQERVRCWKNIGNRSFNLPHCRKLAQDILNRKVRLNGESIIIGETGLDLSAQHRLTALILACHIWTATKNEKIKANWPHEPTWPSLLVRGIKEDQETVSTIDNTKPRDSGDVIETSGMFLEDADGKAMSAADRRECSRMMASAVDFMWVRTRAGSKGSM